MESTIKQLFYELNINNNKIRNPPNIYILLVYKSTAVILIYSLTINSSVASGRTARFKVTIGTAPTFRSSDRAEKRKEVPCL